MAREKFRRNVEDLEKAMSGMKIEDASGLAKQADPQSDITRSQKDETNIPHIKPSVRIPVGKVANKFDEKTYNYLWEYVAGVYENALQIGSGISFFFNDARLPGDDYCKWDIPANKPVKVPRFIAQHLANNLAWKEMKPLAKQQDPKPFHPEDMTAPFNDFVVKKRGTFQPLSAF